jgi:hypothetical protein
VIVGAAGVCGDVKLGFIADLPPDPAPERSGGLVVCREHEDGSALGENLFRVGTAGARAFFGEIVHAAVMSLREPVFEGGVVRRRFRCGDPDEGEAQGMGLGNDAGFEVGGHGGVK